MTTTAEEEKRECVEKMGQALGEHYSALVQELAHLHYVWSEYIELFGTKESRVDLLNEAAGSTFWLIEDTLWEKLLLNIARLTDPPSSPGKGSRTNLSVRSLPELVDVRLRDEVKSSVELAVSKSEFCRDWRNRHIAHRDLALVLQKSARPLASASRAQVNDALNALVEVLNSVQRHYMDAETSYDLESVISGALCLIQVIYDGVHAEKERSIRLENGTLTAEDEARWSFEL